LQIKIPLKNVKDSETTDHISTMKQNIEIMNQVVKNFYAIHGKDKADRRVQNYVSMEIFVEKEMIKFILGVPKEYVETLEKNISSFYAGAVIDYIEQPKILDAGKFYGG
jgi:DNA primase